MISARRPDSEAIRQIIVEERRLPQRWHSVDLAQLRSRIGAPPAEPTPVSALLGDTRSGPRPGDKVDVAAACVVIGRGRRRIGVPVDRFVVIGRDAGLPPRDAPSANDNAPAAKAPRPMRVSVREIVLLAMLAASLVGAFYSGRMHAAQNVIVVPAPSSPRNALT